MKEQIDLFTESINDAAPLAYRVRPKEISLFFGQNQLKERLKTLDYQNMPHIVFLWATRKRKNDNGPYIGQ